MISASDLGTVLKIAKLIYERVQLVKVNQAQCRRLVERIQVAETAIRGLDQVSNTAHFQKGLLMLEECLAECLRYIDQFTEQKKWYQQALKAKDNEAEWEALSKQLKACLLFLNLGMVAEQLTNHEQDLADQKADANALKAGQAEILSLNHAMMQELQAFKGAAAERDKLLALQLTSLKSYLQALHRPLKEEKSVASLEHAIPYCELLFDALIEEGDTSQVYSGRWAEQSVMIKFLSCSLSSAESAEFIREISIIKRLRHPHIVQFYGACLEEGQACLVMEAMPQGNLYACLGQNALSPLQQKQIALDIARGLQYLHKNDMIHRDLKSQVILLTENHRAKLSHFGFTKMQIASIQSMAPLNLAVPWCAPELLTGNAITAKADIYSLGTILWELFSDKKPFEGLSLSKVTQKILAGEREQLSDDIPAEIKTLITACWSADSKNRPNITEVIQCLETYNLAKVCYQKARGLEQARDFKAAGQHYQVAADLGLANAMTSLGMFALSGKGETGVDKTRAYQLFLTAAQKGHPRAMQNAAIMLDKGDGIPQDQAKALEWYQKAGDPASLTRAKRLQEKLSAVGTTLSL